MNAHTPLQNTCVLLCLFIIISSPWDRGLSKAADGNDLKWASSEIFHPSNHQLQLATFPSWNIVIFLSMQINLKDNNTETVRPRPRVPLFPTWSCSINIRQGTERRSILHLEGKRAPLIIIRSPRKVVPCPWSSWCRWLSERGHYSFRASQPIIFLIRLMILFEESDSLASILNASCSLTNWLTVPLNEEGSEASVTLSRRECLSL